MVQLMALPPLISCSSKIQNGLPFWCRLTQVVLEKRLLNGCSSSSSFTAKLCCNVGCLLCLLYDIVNAGVNGTTYRVAQKFGTIILYTLTLPNINRFSKLFHYQNQEKICNNIVTKDSTTPKCVATLPCEMSSVLKATIENKRTSVTTHFKQLTTGNNVFIVSVIV